MAFSQAIYVSLAFLESTWQSLTEAHKLVFGHSSMKIYMFFIQLINFFDKIVK